MAKAQGGTKGHPSYLILQKASDIVFEYAHEKRPTVISMSDETDDFNVLWNQLDQIGLDLCKVATIDKALKTVRYFGAEWISP